jgi:hypothetical protein
VVHKKMVRSVVKKTVCKRQDHCRTEKWFVSACAKHWSMKMTKLKDCTL